MLAPFYFIGALIEVEMKILLVLYMLILFTLPVCYAEVKNVKVGGGEGGGSPGIGWYNLNEPKPADEEKKEGIDVGANIDVDTEYNITSDLYTGVKSDGGNTDITIFRKWKF
jgi:hypothetical protein